VAEPQQPQDIQVVVDERGAVSDVVIPAGWDKTVIPKDLGNVVRDKANEAIAQYIGAQIEHFDEAAATPAAAAAKPVLGDPDALLAEVMTLFAQVDAELTTFAGQVRAAAAASYAGEGMNRKVSVTMSHGQVTGVVLDQHWLAGARHTEVRAEVLSAFQAAARQVATSGAGTVRLPPALARLQELAGDPVALNRQLGMAQ
jgi:hypothetical protein